MSDIEEPSTKVTNMEVTPDYTEIETLDESQEEWLSEEGLTDDDNTAQVEQNNESNLNVTNEDVVPSITSEYLDSDSQDANENPVETAQSTQNNIEQTLTSLEADDLPGDLNDFLIKKPAVEKTASPNTEEAKPADDEDANDTDDLLRMLGDDDKKVKKKALKSLKERNADRHDGTSSGDDDDDDFIYEGAKMSNLKAAKNVLMKKYPAKKAEPEDMSDGDDETNASSDEKHSPAKVRKIMNNRPLLPPSITIKAVPSSALKKPYSQATSVTQKSTVTLKNVGTATSTPIKQKHKSNQSKSILKTPASRVKVTKPAVTFKVAPKAAVKVEPEEIINEDEFLEDDDFDLDEEEFGEDSDEASSSGAGRPRGLARPERMDEAPPTDDTLSEDGSLYDEVPSSDSDDMDDWFTLDIRAERAAEYLPLLGSKAYDLLTEEKRRVTSRLTSLRRSLTALTDSGKRQADQLRDATMNLAELDDMLRAS